MTEAINKQFKKASTIIQSFPKSTKIRVVSHYDADGISSAAIISKVLKRAGYNFHTTLMRNPFDKGLEKVAKEDNDLIIFSDMGSGQIETIEKMNSKSIIIDHHQYLKEKTKENVLQINANLCGINGNYEACGATLSFALAKEINPKNKDQAPIAICGAIGDKQYIGGFRGFNKKILDEAIENKIITEKIDIKLSGENIFDALYYSIDPYYLGISGNKNEIENILKKLDIKNDEKVDELSQEKKKKINSLLMLCLINNGCEKNILDTIIRPRYYSKNFDFELEVLADLLDSCGKGGNRGLGLALLLDDKDALHDAIKLEKEYKQKIIYELIMLEKNNIKEMKSYRYFYSSDSSLGGVIAGIATNFIFDSKKPLISLVKNKDELHVSCRGNQYLVEKGLDLGVAMNEAAKIIGGHGGGHKIASGATIALEKEKEFLEIVDSIISKQMKDEL